jgi:hypothetical protein
MAAEMHDAVDTGGDFLHLSIVGEVGGSEFLVRAQVCGFADIAKADTAIDAFEQCAQPRSDVAGRAGYQDMHFNFPWL